MAERIVESDSLAGVVIVKQSSSLLSAFSTSSILVVGDLMLDEYLWGHIERISPEAPVPILNLVRRESMLGGAGNVMRNLRSLGAQVTAAGVVGRDSGGDQISRAARPARGRG